MSLKLQTIVCSTRPGRIGPSIGQWFNDYANDQGQFESTLVDVADFNLPVFDEQQGRWLFGAGLHVVPCGAWRS